METDAKCPRRQWLDLGSKIPSTWQMLKHTCALDRDSKILRDILEYVLFSAFLANNSREKS